MRQSPPAANVAHAPMNVPGMWTSHACIAWMHIRKATAAVIA